MSPIASRNKDEKIPLKGSRVHIESWFWAIVFVSILIVATFPSINAMVTPADEFVVFNEARLDQFASHPAGHKVVLLGDSRLKYASVSDERLADLAARSTADIAFIRIVQNQAQFSDFEPFLKDILGAQPDLLVLQGSLLSRHRHNNVEYRDFQKLIAWALFDGEGTWNPDGVDQRELQFGTPCNEGDAAGNPAKLNAREFNAAVHEVRRRGNPDPVGPNAAAARTFIAEAREQGASVVILNLPATPSYFQVIDEAFPEYVAPPVETNATTWEYPGRFATTNYCDLIHLDADARATFSEWFTFMTKQEIENRAEKVNMAWRANAEID